MSPPPAPEWLPEALRDTPKDLSLTGSETYRTAYDALTPEQKVEFACWTRAKSVASERTAHFARVGYAACHEHQPERYPLPWNELPAPAQLKYRTWALDAWEYAFREGIAPSLLGVARDAPAAFLCAVAGAFFDP